MRLEDKILSGYAYSVDFGMEEIPALHTGQGGILLYIEECRKNGLDDEFIGASIVVHTEKGSFNINDVKPIER